MVTAVSSAATTAAAAHMLKNPLASRRNKKKLLLKKMFTAEQVGHMFSVVVPEMLCQFQRAMFNEGEVDTKWYDQSSAVRLIKSKP